MSQKKPIPFAGSSPCSQGVATMKTKSRRAPTRSQAEKTLEIAQIEAWRKVCRAIQRLPNDRQERVLRAAAEVNGIIL